MFRRLVRFGSFLACWRQANVSLTPKCSPSSLLPITDRFPITSLLSEVFERLLSVRLGQFMERSGVFPTTHFVYRKGMGTSPYLRCTFVGVPYTAKCIGDWALETRIVQLDFSAAFVGVNNQGILCKLGSCGYWRFCVVYIDTVTSAGRYFLRFICI